MDLGSNGALQRACAVPAGPPGRARARGPGLCPAPARRRSFTAASKEPRQAYLAAARWRRNRQRTEDDIATNPLPFSPRIWGDLSLRSGREMFGKQFVGQVGASLLGSVAAPAAPASTDDANAISDGAILNFAARRQRRDQHQRLTRTG